MCGICAALKHAWTSWHKLIPCIFYVCVFASGGWIGIIIMHMMHACYNKIQNDDYNIQYIMLKFASLMPLYVKHDHKVKCQNVAITNNN